MKLNEEYQRKVEENLGLVHKVIKDKVHGPYQLGIYSREDLFQIGCIGLCKAAATDKGGNFSTYAYRLIWNQICDALSYSTRRQANETTCDVIPYTTETNDTDIELGIAIGQAMEKAIQVPLHLPQKVLRLSDSCKKAIPAEKSELGWVPPTSL